ncbi:unnamed protein product [Rhizophagus irregularis]|nr:unnamed protein product [Rhizophagus irregularis]
MNYPKSIFSNLKENDKRGIVVVEKAMTDDGNQVALKYLNENKSIKNFHSKNILVSYGLSRHLIDGTSISISNRMRIPEYIDLQCYKDKLCKRCIYSLGVLFWEIISGQPPRDDRLEPINMILSWK